MDYKQYTRDNSDVSAENQEALTAFEKSMGTVLKVQGARQTGLHISVLTPTHNSTPSSR